MGRKTWLIVIAVFIVIIILVLLFTKFGKMLINKTWDLISDARIATLHPSIRAKAAQFLNEAEKKGYNLRVTSAYRSINEQSDLYNKYLSGGPLAAKPGESYHNFGLAFDVVETEPYGFGEGYPQNRWTEIGKIGKKLGFTWGGDWLGEKHDRPHFQYSYGFTTAQLRDRINLGKNLGQYPEISKA